MNNILPSTPLTKPAYIRQNHWREWVVGSSVDGSIVALNVESQDGAKVYESLLYSEDIPRRNDGRLTNHWLKKYERVVSQGGWWCNSGRELGTGELKLWGVFKSDTPRRNPDNPDKLLKRESPPRTATGLFNLRITWAIGLRIAAKYGEKQNYLERIPVAADPSKTEYSQEDVYFWDWVRENPKIGIFVTEGEKKAGALLTAGYCAVGLPGVFNGYRATRDQLGRALKRELIPELKALAGEARAISLAFDKDTKRSTRDKVDQAQEKLGHLLEASGSDVSITDWDSGYGKGVDDFIANHGAEAFHAAVETAKPLGLWKASRLHRLSQVASEVSRDRFLGELAIPENARLVAIKSAKGTGKTEKLVAVTEGAIRDGKKVLLLTHRVQLGQALCKRMKLNYISDVRASVEGKLFGFGLCVDSLHPNSQAQFNAEDWEESVVIIDEVEQVVWHLLNSSTCRAERVPILQQFKALMQAAGQVIVADADLSDLSLDYISGLMGGVKPYIFLNTYENEDTSFAFLSYDKPELLLSEALKTLQSGLKTFICCSGQRKSSTWGTQNLEGFFKKKLPDLKILRIDSESVSDPSHPAYGCMGNLDEVLSQYDCVLASPVIETGVSIDLRDYFAGVFCFAVGVQAENSVRQAISRVREPIVRHLYLAKRGLNKIGNGGLTWKSLLTGQNKEFKAHLNLLKQADASGFLEALDDPDLHQTFQPESLKAWAKFACRHNLGMGAYREIILSAIEDEGHYRFEPPEPPETPKDVGAPGLIKSELKTLKKTNYEDECEAIANSPSFESEADYLKSKNKRAKTEAERRWERHWEVNRRYGRVTAELIKLDDDGEYQRLRLLYFLTVGRHYLSSRDSAKARTLLESGAGRLFAPDFNRSQMSAKVETLRLLGIPELLHDCDRDFTNNDSDLIELRDKVLANWWEIRQMGLGTFTEQNNPTRVLRKLLNNLGFSLERVGRESKGRRDYRYRFNFNRDGEDFRGDVFAFWLERDEDLARRAAERKSSSGAVDTSLPNPSTFLLDKNLKQNLLDKKLDDAVKRIENTPPEHLRVLIESCVRAEWWREIADSVWMSVTRPVRQLIDSLDFESRYGW